MCIYIHIYIYISIYFSICTKYIYALYLKVNVCIPLLLKSWNWNHPAQDEDAWSFHHLTLLPLDVLCPCCGSMKLRWIHLNLFLPWSLHWHHIKCSQEGASALNKTWFKGRLPKKMTFDGKWLFLNLNKLKASPFLKVSLKFLKDL